MTRRPSSTSRAVLRGAGDRVVDVLEPTSRSVGRPVGVRVWMVRAGQTGQGEDLVLATGIVAIGWDVPDLTPIDSREKLETLLRQYHADASDPKVANWGGQIWAFKAAIAVGDLVVLPLKTRSVLAIGEVVGPYEYRPDLPSDVRHTRRVKWRRTDVPRSAVGQDLLY